jgi:hypothetical protein
MSDISSQLRRSSNLFAHGQIDNESRDVLKNAILTGDRATAAAIFAAADGGSSPVSPVPDRRDSRATMEAWRDTGSRRLSELRTAHLVETPENEGSDSESSSSSSSSCSSSESDEDTDSVNDEEDEEDRAARLLETFDAFCSHGVSERKLAERSVAVMTASQFLKLTKDSGLLGGSLKKPTIDLIFMQVRP